MCYGMNYRKRPKGFKYRTLQSSSPGFCGGRDKPGGEQFYVACEGSAETRFHRGKPGWGASLAILF